jgi:hypothetical protein
MNFADIPCKKPNITKVVINGDNRQKTAPQKTCDFMKYHNLFQSCD